MHDTPNSNATDLAAAASCIGVFDSGVGGLSILRALRQRLPEASLLYVGDVAYAPYGDRSAAQVQARCERIVEWLAGQGPKMIVVACNTATVLAIDALRARWPEFVFVGVEPGVKPAIAASRTGRVAVMTTTATAHSARLDRLIKRHAAGAHVHVQPCPGLVEVIERGDLHGAKLRDILAPLCAAIRAEDVDTVALGCTHYPFVEAQIREMLGENVTVIDTASAIAERSASLWQQARSTCDGAGPTMRVLSSGATRPMQALLAQCAGLEGVEVEVLTMIPCAMPG